MQTELTQPGPLLDAHGRLAQVGWSRRPLLDCNLEQARFYALRPLQRFRLKRWDYYAVFTPRRFFSATIADLGYAGNIFVYTLDFASGELHEEGLVIPLGARHPAGAQQHDGRGVVRQRQGLPALRGRPAERRVSVDWPGFHDGRGIQAEIALACPPEHELMNIVIPIGATALLRQHQDQLPAGGGHPCTTARCARNCGRRPAWARWTGGAASGSTAATGTGPAPPASFRRRTGARFGLNLGCGFGDLSKATENCVILDGRIHKLGAVRFDYAPGTTCIPGASPTTRGDWT